MNAEAEVSNPWRGPGPSAWAEYTPPTEEQIAEWRAKRRLKNLARDYSVVTLPRLRIMPPIHLDDWRGTSPFPMTSVPVEEHWRYLWAALYPLKGTYGRLWAGDLTDTGGEEHRDHFRSLKEWLEQPDCPGPHTSPSVFGCEPNKTKGNVMGKPYLVCESDTIPKEQFGNVIRFIRGTLGLRAVVFTGNKSLHAWFDCPSFRPQGKQWTNRAQEALALHHERLADPLWHSLAHVARLRM